MGIRGYENLRYHYSTFDGNTGDRLDSVIVDYILDGNTGKGTSALPNYVLSLMEIWGSRETYISTGVLFSMVTPLP